MTKTSSRSRKLIPACIVQVLLLLTALPFASGLSVRAQKTVKAQSKAPASDHCKPAPKNASGQQPANAQTQMPGIPDTPVLDQDGKRLTFYTDLVKGKVVAINFIFTSCTTICPPLGATFAKIGALGGARFGEDFQLISISIDPVTDSPQRLKAWGQKFNAKPGWTIVTGEKQDIDKLVKALGGFSARIQDHSPMVLIINDRQGTMTRAYGLAPPSRLLEAIDGAGKGMTVDSLVQREEKK